MSSIQRELEHTVDEDDAVGTTDIATLSEEQANLVQMQQIAQQTIEPGKMRLSCTSVSTATSRSKWVVTVEHPVEGEHNVFLDKPVTGWSNDCELATVLRWYNIPDQDPYKLQCHYLTLEYDEEKADQNHGWRLVEPPGYTAPEIPRTTRLKRKLQWRPAREAQTMYAFLLIGSMIGAVSAALLTGVIISVALALVTFVGFTVLGMAVTDPEGGA